MPKNYSFSKCSNSSWNQIILSFHIIFVKISLTAVCSNNQKCLIQFISNHFRSYSFIRGQNAPIDPNILAERTTKRIKALELQNAIKAQVEERERLRKIELEQSLLEERRQEEKLRQQRESNEQRFEEEQRKTRERIERDQRKQEMMRIAIEKARQEAEMEKAKKKRSSCVIPECESPKSNDEMLDMHISTAEIPRSDCSEAQNSPIPSKPVEPDYNDDDEKILIGTPIKMKKKTLNKTYKVPLSAKKEVSVQSENEPIATSEQSATNVDGIALVLQTLPPIMPILSNDIINLNQNINNLNTSNIQLAVMLAHQMQQLNNITQNQNHSQAQNQSLESINNKINAQESNSAEEKHVLTVRNDIESSIPSDVCKQCTGGSNRNSLTRELEKVRILLE